MKPSLQPSPAMLRGANGLWRERRRGRSQMMLSCCSGNLRIVGASAWLAEWQVIGFRARAELLSGVSANLRWAAF